MLAFVVGLNRPFCLEDMFPRLLSSRIPGGQGTIIRVPSWWHFALALPQRLTLTLVFAPSGPASGFLAAVRRLHCSPFCDSTSSSRLPSRSGISTSLPASPCAGISCPRPASPYAPGFNALGFAVVALSAPPTSSTLAVPLAGAGAAPATSCAPPHSCAWVLDGSTLLASVVVTVHAGPK